MLLVLVRSVSEKRGAQVEGFSLVEGPGWNGNTAVIPIVYFPWHVELKGDQARAIHPLSIKVLN